MEGKKMHFAYSLLDGDICGVSCFSTEVLSSWHVARHWKLCQWYSIAELCFPILLCFSDPASSYAACNTFGQCHSSSLPPSRLKVPAISSCYKKKSAEVELTVFIVVDFYVAKHRETQSRAKEMGF